MFQRGDLITVTAREGEWWTGVLNGTQGVFPYNYVQPSGGAARCSPTASHSSSSSSLMDVSGSVAVAVKQTLLVRAKVAFAAQQPGQLSLSPGEYIKVLKQAPSGWWEGQLQSRGKRRQLGWFPANRVELLSRHAERSKSVSGVYVHVLNNT